MTPKLHIVVELQLHSAVPVSDMDSLLPNNSTRFERAIESTLEPSAPNLIDTIWDSDTCPPQFLGVLAFGLSVDEWDDNWPTDIKRKACKTAIEVHRYKGTVHAIRTALNSLNATIDIEEWFESGGAPYTATLVAYAGSNLGDDGNTLLTPEMQAKLWRVVERAKNVRTHIDFSVGVGSKCDLYVTSAPVSMPVSRVTSDATRPSPSPSASMHAAAAFGPSIEAGRISITAS